MAGNRALGRTYEAGGRNPEYAGYLAGRREQVFLQVHVGAVYDENGEYGWCRDFETITETCVYCDHCHPACNAHTGVAIRFLKVEESW